MNLRPIAAAALLLAGTTAQAATISVSSFDVSEYQTALGTFENVVSEDFENPLPGMVGNRFDSDVGNFRVVGDGVGSGGTVDNASFPNDGTQLAIRKGNVYGRESTTLQLTGDPNDDQFLDSNDTFGIRYNAELANGVSFNKILLTLTDAAEFGTRLLIRTEGATNEFITDGDNGGSNTILVDFGGNVSSASIFFVHRKNGERALNDGFSIDDVAISAVPLPASSLLLIAGLGGLAAMRRRKTA